MDKSKRINEKSFRIGIFNVKVAPKDERIDTAVFYANLLKTIYEEDYAFNTRADKFMEFCSMRESEDKRVIYGKLMYYTVLNTDDWYNRKSKTTQKVNIDKTLNPNANEGDYFFIPEAHRFCFVIKAGGIAMSQVEIFLKRAFEKVVPESMTFFITKELTEDVIEKIIQAETLSKLNIDISYTNNDLTSEFDKLIDDDLKDSQVQNLHLEAKSFTRESINLLKSKLLNAALRLSRSNGYAEAVIKENGKTKTISTSEYPRIEHIFSTEGNENIDVYKRIIELFRNGTQK
jgi:hypothetical protein